MTNADVFKNIFGLYATELWAKSENEFLEWLNAEATLKAQEPVEPKIVEFEDKGLTWEKYEVPTCGVCGALLGDALFCPMCGRAVKWE